MSLTRQKTWGHLLSALTLLLAFLMFFPILWMVPYLVQDRGDGHSVPAACLFRADACQLALGPVQLAFLEYLWNTVVITFFSIVLALLLGIPSAYAMAFYQTKRTDGSLLWMMSTRMLPPAGVIVLFTSFFCASTCWTRIWVVIILYAGMNFPLVVWMLRSFMLESSLRNHRSRAAGRREPCGRNSPTSSCRCSSLV